MAGKTLGHELADKKNVLFFYLTRPFSNETTMIGLKHIHPVK